MSKRKERNYKQKRKNLKRPLTALIKIISYFFMINVHVYDAVAWQAEQAAKIKILYIHTFAYTQSICHYFP